MSVCVGVFILAFACMFIRVSVCVFIRVYACACVYTSVCCVFLNEHTSLCACVSIKHSIALIAYKSITSGNKARGSPCSLPEDD